MLAMVQERAQVLNLDLRCANEKGVPIRRPDQMARGLRWSKLDPDHQEAIRGKFWARNYEGDLRVAFPGEKFDLVSGLMELKERLLGFGGEEACLPAWEEDLEKIMARGQFWYGARAKKMPGRPSDCHRNACLLWEANQGQVHIATGYALSKDGLWRQHSWAIWERQSRNTVVETTESRIGYFGFVMTKEEAERFYMDNL